MNVICLGDSLTVGLGVPSSQRWTALAARQAGITMLNYGVNGDTTGGMLCRLQTMLSPEMIRSMQRGQTRIFVMGGSNDVFFSGADRGARENLGALVSQLLMYGVRPWMGIPLPICPTHISSRWVNLTDFSLAALALSHFSQWLLRFCACFDLQSVDFRPDFLSSDGTPNRVLFLDGLHPTPEGHRLMAGRFIRSFLVDTDRP